jgi:hypothetical protein
LTPLVHWENAVVGYIMNSELIRVDVTLGAYRFIEVNRTNKVRFRMK